MKHGMAFLLHMFFDDRRIPVGVGTGMLITAIFFRTILPPWATDMAYLGMLLATLVWSVLANAGD